MSLVTRLTDLSTRIATEVKALRTLINGNAAGHSALTTTNKTNLVAALNELKTLIPAASASIDDASTAAGTTWSSTKINSQINAAIAALVNGAPGSSDTLKELADQLAALVQADTGLLSFAGAQTLTAGQKTQGCTNLGVGEPETDFVTVFNTGLQ